MKKLLVLFLVFSVTLLTANAVLAKSDGSLSYQFVASDFDNPYLPSNNVDGRFGKSFPTFEGWYSIEKEAPSAEIGKSFKNSVEVYNLNIYQNDQTFADLRLIDNDGYGYTFINASYLFSNNIFVGFESYEEHSEAQFVLSPGYRFGWGDNGYISLGIDYALNNEGYLYDDKGIIDYELKVRYYTGKSKLYGQIAYANTDVIRNDDFDLYLAAGGAYQVAENIVLGGRVWMIPDLVTIFELGCTAGFDKFGVELSYIHCNLDFEAEDSVQYMVHTNVLYSFTDKLRAGIELAKQEDFEVAMIAKAKYTLDDKKSVVLTHQFAADGDYGDVYTVTYLGMNYKF